MPRRPVAAKLRPTRTRGAVLHVRLSEVQLRALERAAASQGVGVSTLVRAAVAREVKRAGLPWPEVEGE